MPLISPESAAQCPICEGLFKKGKALATHLKVKHGLDLDKAHSQYPTTVETAYHPAPIRRAPVEADPNAEGTEPPAEVDYATQTYDKLNKAERKYFDARFELIFQRVERDPDLLGDINSLLFAEIDLLKFRNSSRERYDKGDFSKAKFYEDVIKNLEDRRLKLMNSLGISRSEKTKNKTQIKSSVASLIAGFENEIELISPEQYEASVMDEQKSLALMHERVNRYLIAPAPVIERAEEKAHEPTLDFESIVRDADIPF